MKRVKIADMIHNTQDLVSLKPEGIGRKINDAEHFYITMGRKVAPLMIKKLEHNLLTIFNKTQAKKIMDVCQNRELLESMSVPNFMELLVKR